MDNRHEEHMYTYRRVKLSSLYKEIGDFLKEHGDADVRSIGSCHRALAPRWAPTVVELSRQMS